MIDFRRFAWGGACLALALSVACSSSSSGGAPDDATTPSDDTATPSGETAIESGDESGDSSTGDSGAVLDGDAIVDSGVDTGSPYCEAGTIGDEPCGKCGTHSRLCDDDAGTWMPWGACSAEKGDCVPASTRTTKCGKCGSRIDTCSDTCGWQSGKCASEGVCNPGDVETAFGGCPTAKMTKTRTCSASCAWADWTDCAAIKGWDDMSTPTAISFAGRTYHTAIWTGTDMVVWGGQSSSSSYAADGAQYNLASDTWKMLPAAPILGRYGHTAVWTGKSMIVWGGYSSGAYRNDGAILDFSGATPTWITMAPAPTTLAGRYNHTAVWTGTEMVVWGGSGSTCTGGSYCSDGAAYNPSTNAWRMLGTSTIAGRYYHSALWNGSKMIVFGGYGSSCSGSYCADGAVWEPIANAWSAFKTPWPYDGRYQQMAVATGSGGTLATFFGGYGTYVSPSYYKNNGASYDDAAGVWKPISAPSETILPSAKRYAACAWWGAGKLFIWGGYGDGGVQSNGASYDPTTDTWTSLPAGGPTARYQATTVWTGSEAIIWGGYGSRNDGKVYRP